MASFRTTTRLLRRFISSPPCHSPLCASRNSSLSTFSQSTIHSPRRLLIPTVTRTFTTTHAARAVAPHPPSEPTELLAYPTPETLVQPEDPDEPEVELIPLEEAKIEVTERAAEQLRSLAKKQDNPEAGLRVSVESGGCHGYQYKMVLATKRQPDDYLFSHPSVKPSNILIDAVSMSLLKGAVIDFATELIGSSFRILDNPQVSTLLYYCNGPAL